MIRVGVFTSVYHREDEVRAAMDSWILTHASGLELSWHVGFNGGPKTLLDYVNSFICKISENKQKSLLMISQSNVGKSVIINSMVLNANKKGHQFDFIVSIDSDMVMKDPDWLLKFIDIYKAASSVKLGGLACNQEGRSCHVLNDQLITEYINGYTLITRANNEGVAGGVLFLPMGMWNTIGGYRSNKIFGGSDGNLTKDVWDKGYLLPMVKEICFWHPPVTDEKYQDWKYRSAHGLLKPDEQKGYYESRNDSSIPGK